MSTRLLILLALWPAALSAQDQCGQRESAPGLLVTAAWLKRHQQDSNLVVLAAERTRASYDSAHVAGARPVTPAEYTATRAGLRRLLTAAGATPGKEIVTYCRVGSRASELYFVARLLGVPVRLYDGSMNDWAGRRELPVVKP